MKDVQELTKSLREDDSGYFRDLRECLEVGGGLDARSLALATVFPDGYDHHTHTDIECFVVVTAERRALRGYNRCPADGPQGKVAAHLERLDDITDSLRWGRGFALPVADAMSLLDRESQE